MSELPEETRQFELRILFNDQKQANLRLSRIERLLELEPEDSTPARGNLESLRGEIVQVLRDVVKVAQDSATGAYSELTERAIMERAHSVLDFNADNARAVLEKLGEKV